MIRKERNKVLKIMDELNKYFIENTDTCHITSTLDFSNETKIRFRVHLNNKEEIERVKAKLEKIFSVQRYREVEELYWNLTGDSYSSDETNLVGMMVDEFSIEVEDNVLILYLIRR